MVEKKKVIFLKKGEEGIEKFPEPAEEVIVLERGREPRRELKPRRVLEERRKKAREAEREKKRRERRGRAFITPAEAGIEARPGEVVVLTPEQVEERRIGVVEKATLVAGASARGITIQEERRRVAEERKRIRTAPLRELPIGRRIREIPSRVSTRLIETQARAIGRPTTPEKARVVGEFVGETLLFAPLGALTSLKAARFAPRLIGVGGIEGKLATKATATRVGFATETETLGVAAGISREISTPLGRAVISKGAARGIRPRVDLRTARVRAVPKGPITITEAITFPLTRTERVVSAEGVGVVKRGRRAPERFLTKAIGLSTPKTSLAIVRVKPARGPEVIALAALRRKRILPRRVKVQPGVSRRPTTIQQQLVQDQALVSEATIAAAASVTPVSIPTAAGVPALIAPVRRVVTRQRVITTPALSTKALIAERPATAVLPRVTPRARPVTRPRAAARPRAVPRAVTAVIPSVASILRETPRVAPRIAQRPRAIPRLRAPTVVLERPVATRRFGPAIPRLIPAPIPFFPIVLPLAGEEPITPRRRRRRRVEEGLIFAPGFTARVLGIRRRLTAKELREPSAIGIRPIPI